MITMTTRRTNEETELSPGERIVKVHNQEMVAKDSYHGRVVYRGEHNYYDDSDFYAVVSIDGSFREIEYATTRYSTYGNHAKIDAPPSLRTEYRKWEKRQAARRRMIEETKLWEDMNKEMGIFVTAAAGNENTLTALENLFEDSRWRYVLKALNNAKRSQFRLNLRKQVLTWIDRKNQEIETYDFPLSNNQFHAIAQYKRRYE